MDKKKIIKIFLLIILLLFLTLIILTIRKTIILSDIDTKVSNLENNKKNIYMKMTSITSEYTLETERFIKDDIDKLILKKKNKDGTETKTIQYDNAERHRVYTEKDGNINLTTDTVYEGISPKPVRGAHIEAPEGVTPFASYTVIPNAGGYSISLPERIKNSIFTSLKTVKIDGKECYEVSGKYSYSPSILYDENTEKISIYVEKETGLTIKTVEIISENGHEVENIATFEYNFDTVTDEDIKEPI